LHTSETTKLILILPIILKGFGGYTSFSDTHYSGLEQRRDGLGMGLMLLFLLMQDTLKYIQFIFWNLLNQNYSLDIVQNIEHDPEY